MALFWFIAFVLFLIIELITVNLVTIWFAIGAVASMIATIMTDSFVIQVIVFIVISLVCLLVTKPLVQKFKGFNVHPTNSDRVIGKVGEVTKKITKSELEIIEDLAFEMDINGFIQDLEENEEQYVPNL